MRIKKGDTVKILTGKDKGKTGTVNKVLPEKRRVVVEGLNLYKKRVRPTKQGEQGQTVEIPRPMAVSNVAIICKSCKKQTRVGSEGEGAQKKRVCKKCGASL